MVDFSNIKVNNQKSILKIKYYFNIMNQVFSICEAAARRSSTMECRDHSNAASPKSLMSRGKQLKMKVLLAVFFCIMIANSSFGQFFLSNEKLLAGLSGGVDVYRWDRIPTNQTEGQKISNGGVISLNLGVSVGYGNEKYRFLIDGYSNYVPLSFSLKKFNGMGSNSFGTLVKFSITPFGIKGNKKGFTIGIGGEDNEIDLYFRKKDIIREPFSTVYVYIAYSKIAASDGIPQQLDIFAKVGKGDYSALNIEFGIKFTIFDANRILFERLVDL